MKTRVKRLSGLFLSGVLILSLAACGAEPAIMMAKRQDRSSDRHAVVLPVRKLPGHDGGVGKYKILPVDPWSNTAHIDLLGQ